MEKAAADPSWLNLVKFCVVAFVIPVAYVGVNSGLRFLMSGEKKAENAYLGVDLTLAAFVSVGLYALEPQTRFSPLFRWETPSVVKALSEYGLGLAVALDFLALFWAMCIHADYLQNRSKAVSPTRWHKICTGLLNLVWNNFLGLASFAVSAFLLRG